MSEFLNEVKPSIERLPYPLALRIKAFEKYKDPFRQLWLVKDISEIIIKYHAAIILSTYYYNYRNSITNEEKIEFKNLLDEPTLGTWLTYSKKYFEKIKYNCIIKELDSNRFHKYYSLAWELLKLRNDLAHGAVPPDPECYRDLETFIPIIYKLLNSDYLYNYDLIVSDGSGNPKKAMGLNLSPAPINEKLTRLSIYLWDNRNKPLNLFPYMTNRPFDEEEKIFFFNDYRRWLNISLLNYETAVLYRDDNEYKELVNEYFDIDGAIKNKLGNKFIRSEDINTINSDAINFVGRETELVELFEFIRSENSGYYFLIGTPGNGKSALVSRFLEMCMEDKCMSNPIFPVFIRQGKEIETIRILARLLELINIQAKSDGDKKTTANKISESLSYWSKKDYQTIIVLDGFDNAFNPTELANYLPKDLPKNNIKIIVSSRPIHELNEFMCAIGRNQSRKKELTNLTRNNIREILYKYVNKYTIEERHVNSIFKKSDGNPLFISFLCKDIENRIIDINNIEKLPDAIYGFYERVLRGENSITNKKILLSIAACQEFVSNEIISEISGIDKFEIDSYLNKLLALLKIDKTDKGIKKYQLYHSSLLDYLKTYLPDTLNEYKSKALEFCKNYRNYPPKSYKRTFAIRNLVFYSKDTDIGDTSEIVKFATDFDLLDELKNLPDGGLIIHEIYETSLNTVINNDLDSLINIAECYDYISEEVEVNLEVLIEKIISGKYKVVENYLRYSVNKELVYLRLLFVSIFKSPDKAFTIYHDNIECFSFLNTVWVDEKQFLTSLIVPRCLEDDQLKIRLEKRLNEINSFNIIDPKELHLFKEILSTREDETKELTCLIERKLEKLNSIDFAQEKYFITDILDNEKESSNLLQQKLHNRLMSLNEDNCSDKEVTAISIKEALLSDDYSRETKCRNLYYKIKYLKNISIITHLSEIGVEFLSEIIHSQTSFEKFILAKILIEKIYGGQIKNRYEFTSEKWNDFFVKSHDILMTLGLISERFSEINDSVIYIQPPKVEEIKLFVEDISQKYTIEIIKHRDGNTHTFSSSNGENDQYIRSQLKYYYFISVINLFYNLDKESFKLVDVYYKTKIKCNCQNGKSLDSLELGDELLELSSVDDVKVECSDNNIFIRDSSILSLLLLNKKFYENKVFIDLMVTSYKLIDMKNEHIVRIVLLKHPIKEYFYDFEDRFLWNEITWRAINQLKLFLKNSNYIFEEEFEFEYTNAIISTIEKINENITLGNTNPQSNNYNDLDIYEFSIFDELDFSSLKNDIIVKIINNNNFPNVESLTTLLWLSNLNENIKLSHYLKALQNTFIKKGSVQTNLEKMPDNSQFYRNCHYQNKFPLDHSIVASTECIIKKGHFELLYNLFNEPCIYSSYSSNLDYRRIIIEEFQNESILSQAMNDREKRLKIQEEQLEQWNEEFEIEDGKIREKYIDYDELDRQNKEIYYEQLYEEIKKDGRRQFSINQLSSDSKIWIESIISVVRQLSDYLNDNVIKCLYSYLNRYYDSSALTSYGFVLDEKIQTQTKSQKKYLNDCKDLEINWTNEVNQLLFENSKQNMSQVLSILKLNSEKVKTFRPEYFEKEELLQVLKENFFCEPIRKGILHALLSLNSTSDIARKKITIINNESPEALAEYFDSEINSKVLKDKNDIVILDRIDNLLANKFNRYVGEGDIRFKYGVLYGAINGCEIDWRQLISDEYEVIDKAENSEILRLNEVLPQIEKLILNFCEGDLLKKYFPNI